MKTKKKKKKKKKTMNNAMITNAENYVSVVFWLMMS